MYSSLGYTSIQIGINHQMTSPINQMLLNQSFWTPTEQQLYRDEMRSHINDLMKDNNDLTDRKCILHTFSNGGMQCYQNIKPLLPTPSAYIFDSAPGSPGVIESFDIPGKIFRSNNPTAALPVSAAISTLANVGYCFRFLLFPFRQMNLLPSNMVPRLHETVGTAPCLVINGTDDVIIKPKNVRDAVAMLDAKGSRIEQHEMSGEHCLLLRENPSLYTGLICDFIEKIKE